MQVFLKTTLAERARPDTQLHYHVVYFIVEFFIEENMISTSGNIVTCIYTRARHFGGQIAIVLVHPPAGDAARASFEL